MKAKSTTLYYDHYMSPLGAIVLGATEHGLCALYFVGGNSGAKASAKSKTKPSKAILEKTLRTHLPADLKDAPLQASPTKLAPARAWLKRYFAKQESTPEDLKMPLDLHGTDFQKRVWKQLARIPYGSTASYGQVAKKIRKPLASRAVGLANNRNPVSLVIPCHRVVGSTGKLVGYGGGLWRKEALLRMEEGDLFDAKPAR